MDFQTIFDSKVLTNKLITMVECMAISKPLKIKVANPNTAFDT